jgi:transcriptional antiterminator RfaH
MYSVKESRWYLVQCKPREGFRAAEHLQNQSYTCFHPTYLVKRKVAGRVQSVEASLFPHYLFIYLSSSDNWSSIRSTRGVNKIVHFNGIPASLDDRVVEELQRQCARLRGEAPISLYKVGDRVLVTDGCFKELEAIVTATDADERVTLLLNLLNRPQHIELSVNSVVGLA